MPLAFGPWKRTTATKSPVEFAGLERALQGVLRRTRGRCLDHVALRGDGRGLDHRPAEIAAQHV
jgi:hypothetical protein